MLFVAKGPNPFKCFLQNSSLCFFRISLSVGKDKTAYIGSFQTHLGRTPAPGTRGVFHIVQHQYKKGYEDPQKREQTFLFKETAAKKLMFLKDQAMNYSMHLASKKLYDQGLVL